VTTEPHESENNLVDRLTNQWLDAEPGDFESGESAIGMSESLDKEQLRHAASLQLVHAMLIHLAENNEDSKQRRINKLMQSVRADKEKQASEKATSPQKPRRYVGPVVRWGIAAMIIISVTISLVSLPPNKAMATIDQMIAAIENAGDRTYSIIVRDQRTGRRERKSGRFTVERRNRQERAVFDGATLYLRGRDKYVLYRFTPSGETVINGSDGQTNWLIRPKRPVLVSNNPQAFRIPMPEDLANLLTLDFSDTLQQIREHYKIKYLGTVPVDQDQEALWTYLHATQRKRKFKGPRVIRTWAHPDTGLLRRIEFADIHLQNNPEPKKLILDLMDQKQLPETWFTHTAHHSEDTEVDVLSEE
jgi:outer membrane lipoprotein-sorting protein